MKYAVLDANIIIDRKIEQYDFEQGYTTPSIMDEIKNEDLRLYLDRYMYKIEVKSPTEKYVKKVHLLQKENNLLLSVADIDIIALTIEIKEYIDSTKFNEWISKDKLNVTVECLSRDKGIQQCLKLLSDASDGSSREFMFRCGSCFTLFNTQLDFCKKCASNLITRVSVTRFGKKIRVFFKKGYIRRKKVLKDKYGNVLKSADQKEYIRYKKEKDKALK